MWMYEDGIGPLSAVADVGRELIIAAQNSMDMEKTIAVWIRLTDMSFVGYIIYWVLGLISRFSRWLGPSFLSSEVGPNMGGSDTVRPNLAFSTSDRTSGPGSRDSLDSSLFVTSSSVDPRVSPTSVPSVSDDGSGVLTSAESRQ